MANSAKNKGDRFERQAVRVLAELLAPEIAAERLTRAPEWKPDRMLGAGRKEDIGDLDIISAVTFQVKAFNNAGTAIRSAADGAHIQSRRAGTKFNAGLVPIMGRTVAEVRWLVASYQWPIPLAPKLFSDTTAAVTWMRTASVGMRVEHRVCFIERAGTVPIWVGTLQAWIEAFRTANGGAPEAVTDLRDLRPMAPPAVTKGGTRPANVEGQLQLIA